MAESITIQMERLLEGYSKEVSEAVEKAASGVASASVNKLKKHSPKGHGTKHYADGWKKKRVSKTEFTVYNATKPGLTHLLNDGHVVKNQKGTYGRVKGDGHIDEVARWAESEFVKRTEKKL